MATTTQPVVNAQLDTQTAKRDFRQEVTDSIVQMLEQGVAPWQKPWEAAAGAFEVPVNPTTEKSYRGGNAVHLMATALRKGYDDPRWMTYRQAAENGWQVRKGEKGTQIASLSMRSRQLRFEIVLEHTPAALLIGAGKSGQNISFIRFDKVSEQTRSANHEVRVMDGWHIFLGEPFGVSFGELARASRGFLLIGRFVLCSASTPIGLTRKEAASC